MIRLRIVLGSASVAAIGTAGGMAVVLGPAASHPWLLFCVVLAVATAIQSVASEPKELTPALLFSLPPVMALAGEGSPSWLIGPLAVLLLLAGELNALSWRYQSTRQGRAVELRRLVRMIQLSALGLGGSLMIVVVAPYAGSGGTAAFVLAATALAALGPVLFRSAR